MKLTVNSKGVFLDEYKIENVVRVDIKNINPIEPMEAILHITVDEVDAEYSPELLRDEL